jgi:hypothetical protein
MVKKKLQVFISSTFDDLKEERQAAVEAVLMAGHIPAGMELFAAGDESQMNVIKRWIDESDVYLLILGGRYGSVEPKSQMSYTHLEYEYAVDTNKSLFAIVISPDGIEAKVKAFGTKVIETEHSEKLAGLRKLVLSKMVKFWTDPRDIKLAILETLSEFSHRVDLVGWVPGSEAVNGSTILEEMARLTKENAELQQKLQQTSNSQTLGYSSLSFGEMFHLLQTTPADTYLLSTKQLETLDEITRGFGDSHASLLHMFWMVSRVIQNRPALFTQDIDKLNLPALEELGLVMSEYAIPGRRHFSLTSEGRNFLVRLRIEKNVVEIERHRLVEV